MVQIVKPNKIFVGYHEWAWSRRTEGFNIFALVHDDKDGYSLIKVGETTKKPMVYALPPHTFLVVRCYYTNGGYHQLICYSPLDEWKEHILDEKDGFKGDGFVQPEWRKAILDFFGFEVP